MIKHYLDIKLIRSKITSLMATLDVIWRWQVRPARTPHGLPHPVIVSLTSYPPRFNTLPLTLKSLLTQTVKADHTILWIAHDDLPLLPKSVTSLVSQGLEIRAADDTKSYKKILPALDAFPEAYICTADDDLYYWSTWLEELIGGIDLERKEVVPCHNAHTVVANSDGSYRPFLNWEFDAKEQKPSPKLFPQGGCGVLYPPGILKHDRSDREAIPSICPTNDDLWLFWMGRRNGALYRRVSQRGIVQWLRSQHAALWHTNFVTPDGHLVTDGGYDIPARQLAQRYGYPSLISEVIQQYR